MKLALAGVIILSAGVAAYAKPAPVEEPRLTPSPEETVVFLGPAGAMLESDYFRTPQNSPMAGRVFPCRLQLRLFERTQFAQSCR